MSLKHHHAAALPARFGIVLGVGPGDVPVYSSDYDSADPAELPTRQAYRSQIDGVYMGHKWQCVELARRWMYLNKGYIFEDIAMAYDIFGLRQVHATVQISTFRKFTGAGKPCAQFQAALQQLAHDHWPTVPLQLQHILTGV